jgi:hypothetical protein
MDVIERAKLSHHWYAVYTRPRHEQKAYDRLLSKDIETFLNSP